MGGPSIVGHALCSDMRGENIRGCKDIRYSDMMDIKRSEDTRCTDIGMRIDETTDIRKFSSRILRCRLVRRNGQAQATLKM